MAFNFDGKQILVTGAGKGIGRAIAIALHKSGCKVYALSRTSSTLESLKKECPGIVTITQDLQDWDETRTVLEDIGALDGLVNNAGIVDYSGPALEWPKAQLERLMDNNLYSVINCTQVIAGKMVASNRPGSIVNVSSTGSLGAYPNLLGYNVSKAGVDMVTKQFALELGPNKIRVNSIHPTLVMTDAVRDLVESTGLPMADIALERTPIGRLPSVDEIVSPVLYLLSDYSSMVTGTAHVIDDAVRDLVESTGVPMVDIALERTPLGRLPTVDEIVSPVLYLLSEYSSMVTGTAHVIDGGVFCNITTKQ